MAINGWVLRVPTSVSVGSGTGSVSDTGKITFSGATHVDVNGIFDSSFQSYAIMMSVVNVAAETLRMYALQSGTPETSTVWDCVIASVDNTSDSPVAVLNQSFAYIGEAGSTAGLTNGIMAFITDPAAAGATQVNGISAVSSSDGVYTRRYSYRPALSFDGGRFQGNGTNTISGYMMVYGLGE